MQNRWPETKRGVKSGLEESPWTWIHQSGVCTGNRKLQLKGLTQKRKGREATTPSFALWQRIESASIIGSVLAAPILPMAVLISLSTSLTINLRIVLPVCIDRTPA